MKQSEQGTTKDQRSHRGIARDWNSVCTDNDCWCWGSEHHNPREQRPSKEQLSELYQWLIDCANESDPYASQMFMRAASVVGDRLTHEPGSCLCGESLALLWRMRDEHIERGSLSGRLQHEAEELLQKLASRAAQPPCVNYQAGDTRRCVNCGGVELAHYPSQGDG